jgi:hypothetical protein
MGCLVGQAWAKANIGMMLPRTNKRLSLPLTVRDKFRLNAISVFLCDDASAS